MMSSRWRAVAPILDSRERVSSGGDTIRSVAIGNYL
jgi:hypothetical protein